MGVTGPHDRGPVLALGLLWVHDRSQFGMTQEAPAIAGPGHAEALTDLRISHPAGPHEELSLLGESRQVGHRHLVLSFAAEASSFGAWIQCRCHRSAPLTL